MAPRAGIEPATFRLPVERSTAELPRNKPVFTHRAYNKALLLCKARRLEATAGIEPACTDLQAEISPFSNPLTLTDFLTGPQKTLVNKAKRLAINGKRGQ